MPIEQKKSKIIVRDNDGSLVQVLPETDASQVNYGDTNVQSVLEGISEEIADAVENSSAKKVYAEIDPHSETETETIHLQPEGTLTAHTDRTGTGLNVSFSLMLYGHVNGDETAMTIGASDTYSDIWIGRFHSEDGTVLSESRKYVLEDNVVAVPANERYYFDFTLDDPDFTVEGLNALLSGCQFILEDGTSEYRGNTISITGSSYNSRSPYATYANGMLGTTIQFSLPEVGQSSTFYFNTWHDFRNTWDEGNIKNRNKSLTFENLDGTNYRVSFYWDTSKEYEATNTTKWKELKTTLERQDGSTVEESRPLTGLLQDVSIYKETVCDIESVPRQMSYNALVYISDEAEDDLDH